MAKGGKKLKAPQVGSGQRIAAPTPNSEPSPQQQRPHFSLEYLSSDNYRSCETEEQAAFAGTLQKLGQMTWAEIAASHRHKSGTEIIERESLRIPLPSHITEDVNIIALRFSGMKPMLGYRDRRILHILWLDRNYSAYKHS